ncbi:hypothetical protein Acr_01g0008950 [Actinidia rufa]|uniref:Uncharacterized protein n=1 Tax=Actinidia rufa TaxID=165716 RepID=A0A7J0E4J1_9ERIC|nr:hypothetical protein Acr_01g0008950 [Actinidia rufa]
MRSRSKVGDLENLEDSLPYWITGHLVEGSSSFMTNEVNQSTDSPREDPLTLEDVPIVTVSPSVEKEVNIMTPNKLDLLRESYSFPSHMQLRILEEGETMTSTCPGRGGLLRVLRGKASPVQYHCGVHISEVQEDSAQRIPQQHQEVEEKKKFLPWEMTGSSPEGSSQEYGIPRIPKSWSILDVATPKLYGDKVKRVEHVFNSVEEKGLYSVPTLFKSKSFRRVFGPLRPLAFGEENNA